MPVIDVQVHPFDRDHPGRPWASPSHGLDSATGEEMVAAMNSVGVDGAIMVSSFSAYEYDPSYALEVYNTYPDKFRVVTPVDATNPAVDDVVAKWAATPGARGIRIRMRDGLPMDADHPGLNRAFAAAAKHGLPVNLLCWGILDKGLPHIQRHRDTVIVIDHLGLLQPARPPVPADVWADLPKLLALAQYENVRVKISGACTMSHQPFPYDDIWEPVLRVIDAFGLDRCMWGTDWTRTIGMLTYEQGVAPFREGQRKRYTRRLGDHAGLKNYGVNLVRVLPGGQSSARHTHSKQDEFVYVIEGEFVLVTDAGRETVGPGTCIGFPAGTGDGHHFLNLTQKDAIFLVIGDRTASDEVTYPDIDLELKAGPDGVRGFRRKDGTPYPLPARD